VLPVPISISPDDVPAPNDLVAALTKLLHSPDLCSRRWVWEQYDHLIQANTVQRPGGDAAVVAIDGTKKGLAFTIDVTPRYCAADPVTGGKQAVAEAWRNLTAVGATPIALTDNLNFGNPENPLQMGELVFCIHGIGEAARALEFPVVSGNVSLYNETNGVPILPTPAIGGVGLLDDVARHATLAFREEGDVILLVGDTQGHLGQSLYLREIFGREEGAPPPVDLQAERRNGEFVRKLVADGLTRTVHDLSDGGLLIALAEMALAGGIGAQLDPWPTTLPAHAFLFGEDQARYVLAVAPAEAHSILERAKAAGVPIARLGMVGGRALALPGAPPVPLERLRDAHESWFPLYMSASA
jgi:phosphoribosylformylglycinamidine synthase